MADPTFYQRHETPIRVAIGLAVAFIVFQPYSDQSGWHTNPIWSRWGGVDPVASTVNGISDRLSKVENKLGLTGQPQAAGQANPPAVPELKPGEKLEIERTPNGVTIARHPSAPNSELATAAPPPSGEKCVPVRVKNGFRDKAGGYRLSVVTDKESLAACGGDVRKIGGNWPSVQADQGPSGSALVLLPNQQLELWWSAGPHAPCFYGRFAPGQGEVSLLKHACPAAKEADRG